MKRVELTSHYARLPMGTSDRETTGRWFFPMPSLTARTAAVWNVVAMVALVVFVWTFPMLVEWMRFARLPWE